MQNNMPVPEDLVGCRFDVAIAKLRNISRSKASDLISNGTVHIVNRKANKSALLLSSDEIIFEDLVSENFVAKIYENKTSKEESQVSNQILNQAIEQSMTIAYKDEDIVVVDKPVGMAAHKAQGWCGPTVGEALEKRGIGISATAGDENRRGIVSRLDAGTSGLMLVCRTDFAYEEMKKQFANHTVKKTYYALVQGNLDKDKATIEAPIGRAKVSDFRFTITPSGKPAITHWDVLERFGQATLASVNLETGRTHQIRVHFTSIGHPLVGDSMYGANPVLAQKLGLTRQWLHSMELTFTHPRTGKVITVKSNYPSDLQHALEAMRALSK
ncbi:RluA family pseudouridine synthase [Bifidobacteriaceae bacterium NR002]|nr:RluA family pseudouridine synthase [Bifidobacteriaceae bacterium NR002]MDZ7549374.1 RluA family pseudouridine synthase [Bifidobacteriaceae bacterium NR047]